MTKVTIRNIADDLGILNENTITGEYGYTQDEDGTLYVEVWNDTYHGVKQTYRVRIQLDPVED